MTAFSSSAGNKYAQNEKEMHLGFEKNYVRKKQVCCVLIKNTLFGLQSWPLLIEEDSEPVMFSKQSMFC